MSDKPEVPKSDRADHPKYIKTWPARVRIELVNGTRCIGDLHVRYPDGRVSDVLNDERNFLPFTNVVVEADATKYDFLTVAKGQIALVFEIRRA